MQTEHDETAQGTVVDGIVGEFSTYEDYLDSQITDTDLFYLEARRCPARAHRSPALLRGARALIRMRNSRDNLWSWGTGVRERH